MRTRVEWSVAVVDRNGKLVIAAPMYSAEVAAHRACALMNSGEKPSMWNGHHVVVSRTVSEWVRQSA